MLQIKVFGNAQWLILSCLNLVIVLRNKLVDAKAWNMIAKCKDCDSYLHFTTHCCIVLWSWFWKQFLQRLQFIFTFYNLDVTLYFGCGFENKFLMQNLSLEQCVCKHCSLYKRFSASSAQPCFKVRIVYIVQFLQFWKN